MGGEGAVIERGGEGRSALSLGGGGVDDSGEHVVRRDRVHQRLRNRSRHCGRTENQAVKRPSVPVQRLGWYHRPP